MMISVIVPVYNMEKYLSRSVPSLLDQTYDDYEILLIDDGSTDRSGEICEQYAKDNPKIRVCRKNNGGLSSARNKGIDLAKGQFIIFPDPDDWVEADYLKTLMDMHEKMHADLEICGHFKETDGRELIWNDDGRSGLLTKDEALSLLMLWDSFCGYCWNKLFHMDIIRAHRLRFDEELKSIQDLHFAYQYISLCKSVYYDKKPVYHYDAMAGVSSPHMQITDRKLSGLMAYEKIAELTKENNPDIMADAYSNLFNTALSYIYSYFLTGMEEPEILMLLQKKLKESEKWFLSDPRHSGKHKLLGRMAVINPFLFYACSKVKRKLLGE